LEHRCYDCPIHDAVLVLNLRPSNALVGDRYAVLHRDHCDGHLCANELDRRDAAHRFEDVLDDHQNCVCDSDGHHRHVDDLDANRDLQSDHQMKDDHDRLDGRHHDADATDDLGDLRNDHVLVDDHHRDAGATDDRNRNCVRDLDGHHRHVDDLDANRDQQTCHLPMDDQMMDDRNLGDLMTDDHDRLDDHHRDAGVLDDQSQNCADDLDGRHHDAGATDDRNRNYVDDLDGRRRGVDGKVVNRHDEGLWLQRHLGELDGLNHYLVLGDADRFCLV
jgi:hypothetical protein